MQQSRKAGGLVDNSASVYHVNQLSRHVCIRGARDEPQRHYRGLAEPGRHVHGARQVAIHEASEQARLPLEGRETLAVLNG